METPRIGAIRRLILATDHAAPAHVLRGDARLVVDIDLAVLGSDPSRYGY